MSKTPLDMNQFLPAGNAFLTVLGFFLGIASFTVLELELSKPTSKKLLRQHKILLGFEKSLECFVLLKKLNIRYHVFEQHLLHSSCFHLCPLHTETCLHSICIVYASTLNTAYRKLPAKCMLMQCIDLNLYIEMRLGQCMPAPHPLHTPYHALDPSQPACQEGERNNSSCL